MRQLQIVVSPPDDEFLAFPALDDAPGTYTVLVSLTKGEMTSRCENLERYLQSDAGERAPSPRPTPGSADECAQARRDSWLAFLGEAESLTREVRLGPRVRSGPAMTVDERAGGDVETWQGRDSARVLLSLADGRLTEPQVQEAVEAVLDLRGTDLPDLPVARIVLASYWHPAPDQLKANTALVYEHADHRAVTMAAPALARLTAASVWVNVPPGFTVDYDTEGSRQLERVQRTLSQEIYGAYLALDPPDGHVHPRRRGILQTNYGWLAFPSQAWSAGDVVDEQAGVLFARTQDYLIVPAP